MSDIVVGECIDDFEILGIAGRGGMGIVYRARQLSVDRIVALKLIAGDVGSDPDFLARFAREARVAALVEHANVVSVYAAGRHGERPYIVMQWVDGKDLGTLVAEHGALEPERACDIATQIASALDAIHERGLLHRDLKPANVLRRQAKGGDHVYLTDFGIAKFVQAETAPLTKTGFLVGTPGYVAPECIRGEDGDYRSDIYALGCLMFELLAGEQSFHASNAIALCWAHAHDPRPLLSERRPQLGDRFDATLVRAMAIAPSERFESATEFSDALRAALPVVARRPSAPDAAPDPPAAATSDEVTDPPTAVTVAPFTASPPDAAPATPSVVTQPGPPRARSRRLALGAAVLVLAGLVATALAAGGNPFKSSPDPRSVATAPPTTPSTTTTRSNPPPPAGPTLAEDKRAIVSQLRSYASAYNERSIGGLRYLFTPSVERQGPRNNGCSDDASGRPKVLALYRAKFAKNPGTYRFVGLTTKKISVSGSRAHSEQNIAIGGGRAKGSFDFVRFNDGTWRVSRIYSQC